MITLNRISILVPVYNEERHLPEFLERLKGQNVSILIVDDGSTDKSVQIAKQKGVQTLRLQINSGKGNAIRVGLRHLVRKGVEWIIIMDGDGQHLPEEIPLFIEKASSHLFGLINGNRLHDPKGMPWIRILTNRVMSFIVSRLAGLPILDSQCGYKMLSADFIRAAHLESSRFEIEDELLLEAVRLKVRIGFVPVTCVYGQEKSYIHPFRDTIRFIRFVFKHVRRR